MGLRRFYSRNWFIYTMALMIIGAYIFPGIGSKGGLIYPEITIKYGAVGIIFLLSGMSLQTSDLNAAASQMNLHCLIQGISFFIYPLLMSFACTVLETFDFIGKSLSEGLVAVSCMPPPVSSAVILTRSAGGNHAAAIFNSVLGSFLGLVLTPLTLRILCSDLLVTLSIREERRKRKGQLFNHEGLQLGLSASIPLSSTIVQLSSTVLLPLAAGLWLRSKGYHQVISDIIPMSAVSQWMLLLIIFSTFCDMFRSAVLENMITKAFTAAFIVCIMQISLMYLSWWTSQQWLRGSFSRKDTAAVMFCSTHKSLTLGLPILRIMVANVSVLGELALPLLLHHPLQMVLGALLVPSMTSWLHREKRTRIFSAEV